MRLFVGIDVGENVIEKVSEIQKKIRTLADIRLVERENLHFTLKFLGEIDESNLEGVVKTVQKVVSGFKQFKIHTKGIGYFGSPDYIRVVWAGCEEGKENLAEISKNLEKELSHIRTDEYGFKPHITIGRVGNVYDKKKFIEKLEEMKAVDLGAFVVDKIILKQSNVSGKGAIYTDYKVFNL